MNEARRESIKELQKQLRAYDGEASGLGQLERALEVAAENGLTTEDEVYADASRIVSTAQLKRALHEQLIRSSNQASRQDAIRPLGTRLTFT